MAENKDEILANFQACTGIDDVGIALTHLNETDWDLGRAVNRAIPEETANRTNNSSPDIEMLEEIPNPRRYPTRHSIRPTIVDDDPDDDPIVCPDIGLTEFPLKNNRSLDMPSLPSTSQNMDRMLQFVIEFGVTSHLINIASSASVSDLKKKIQNSTDILVCRQALTGWNKQPRTDDVRLCTMQLGPVTRLRLRDTTADGVGDEMIERMGKKYILNVKNETSGKIYSLNYTGDKPVVDVKTDVYNLSNIPARHQAWTGWPAGLTSDSDMLGLLGLDHPVHSLTLRSREPTEDAKKNKRVQRTDDSDDSSIEEFEDAAENFTADDDIFLPDAGSRKLQPLIPDKVEDETVGCLHFADEFSSRYGALHPEFFPGSLEDAIKEACMRPARDRRLLALYLHHDKSVLANVFCTQLLCCESVIQMFSAYFVLWGWDLSFQSNEQRFYNSLKTGVGPMAVMQIRNVPTERLPAIIIISRVRAAIEIMSVVQGVVGVDELMATLSETVDVFQSQQKVEVREEEERSVREMIMMQQDAAYRDSLAKDRAKEEAKREQERIETQEKQRVEMHRQQEEAKKEAERQAVESRLPNEPDETADGITKIRVRLPKGEFLERRFRQNESLQVLFDWLHSQGYRSVEYKILSSWPRRDLTAITATSSFKQMSLCPQETVILEER